MWSVSAFLPWPDLADLFSSSATRHNWLKGFFCIHLSGRLVVIYFQVETIISLNILSHLNSELNYYTKCVYSSPFGIFVYSLNQHCFFGILQSCKNISFTNRQSDSHYFIATSCRILLMELPPSGPVWLID